MYIVYIYLEWILIFVILMVMYKIFRENSDIYVYMNIGYKKLVNWKKKFL